jgi:hypothetical protein
MDKTLREIVSTFFTNLLSILNNEQFNMKQYQNILENLRDNSIHINPNLTFSDQKFYDYLPEILMKYTSNIENSKIRTKLIQKVQKILTLFDYDKALNSLIINGILSTLLTLHKPIKDLTNNLQLILSRNILEGETEIFQIPENICKELKKFVIIKLRKNGYLETFKKIGLKEITALENFEKDINVIINNIFNNGKIFVCQKERLIRSKTCFDFSIYVNSFLYDKFVNADNISKYNSDLINCLITELVNIKNLQDVGLFNYEEIFARISSDKRVKLSRDEYNDLVFNRSLRHLNKRSCTNMSFFIAAAKLRFNTLQRLKNVTTNNERDNNN